MTTRHTMQRLAEPLRIECSYGNTPGPAEGGKRHTGAQSSRGTVDRRDNAHSPMSSSTQVRDPLNQHNRSPGNARPRTDRTPLIRTGYTEANHPGPCPTPVSSTRGSKQRNTFVGGALGRRGVGLCLSVITFVRDLVSCEFA
jgi:hypothetical protein